MPDAAPTLKLPARPTAAAERAELSAPYPAEAITTWGGDDAKSSRVEPHPGMAEPVAD